MIHQYQHDDDVYSVNVERQPDGSVIATIGEHTYHLSAESLSDNVLLLRTDSGQHIAHVAKDGQERFVHVDGTTVTLTVPDQRRSRGRTGASGDLTAQMPGQVREVAVSIGDSVEKGQTLVILEAMKMEIRIAAPDDGTVKAVHVKAGDVVERGQTLVEVTAKPE